MSESITYQNFAIMLKELKNTFKLSVSEKTTKAEGKLERFLIFLLGSDLYAISVKHLREILIGKPVIPVPGAPSNIHGIINYKNKILSVTNIHDMLKIQASKSENVYFLITREDEFESALLVDDLVNIINVKQKDIKPNIAGQNESVDRLITGEIYYREKLVTILDLREEI